MKTPLTLLSCFLLAHSASAFTPGAATSELSVTGSITLDDYAIDIDESDTGENTLSWTETIHYEDITDGEGIQTDLTLDLECSHTVVLSNENNLRITGFGHSTISYVPLEANGNPLPEPGMASVSHTLPGTENIREFSFTGRPRACRLFGSKVDLSTQLFAAELFLEQELEDGSWLVLASTNPLRDNFDFYAFLREGNYRVRATISGDVGFSLSGAASYSYDLIAGELLEGSYTDDRLGTDVNDSPKLIVTTPAILSETDQGDGTTEVVITASLQNTSPCPWHDVRFRVPQNFPGGPTIELLNPGIQLGSIPAESTVAPDPGDTLRVLVPNAQLPAFRDSILDGTRFDTSGKELWVFLFPVESISSSAGWIFSTDKEDVVYSNDPGFSAGIVLVEGPDPGIGPFIVESLPSDIYLQSLDRHLPYFVSKDVERDIHGNYPVNGRQVALHEIMRHGTVHTVVDMSSPTGYDLTHGAEGETVPRIEPVHFNRINIDDAVDLSGSFLLSPGDFGVEMKIEDLNVTRFVVTAGFRAEATLLVETKAEINNTGNNLNAQQKDLIDFQLFSFVLPAGFTLTPELTLSVGASLDAPAGLTIPINSSLDVQFTAGVVDGTPFYDSEVTATPVRVSGPAIYEQVQADIEAWITAQLKCAIGAPGNTAEFGPTFGTRIAGTANIAPLLDPWWSIDGFLELRAGLEIDLVNFLEIFDAEKVIHTEELFSLESEGPLLPPTKAGTLPHNPGLRPLAGKNTRWARALQSHVNTAKEESDVFVAPLIGSDDFLAGGGGTIFDGEIGRYGPDGELKWLLSTFRAPFCSVAAEPDGGFTALGKGSLVHQLSRFDGDGNRIWAIEDKILNTLGHEAREVIRGENSAGEAEYYILGRTHVGERYPSISKYDQNGVLLWSKLYTASPSGGENAACEVRDCIITQDGNLVFVGVTDADINSGIPITTVNINENGLAVKIDSESGAVIWSTLISHGRIPEYNAITEDPYGALYLGGIHRSVVLDDYPSMVISKLNSAGALLNSIVIGHDSTTGDSTELDTAIPHGGETPYDEIQDLAWIDGALWVGGHMGIFNSSLGYLNGTSAFTARLTPDLGVTRFVLHAGPQYDQIGAIADGGDGLLAVGITRSFLPWPAGAADQADNTPYSRLVMKLPWEGALRFHELTAGAQEDPSEPAPDQGSFYNYPVSHPSSHLEFFALGGGPRDVFSDTVPFVVSDLTVSSETPPAAPEFITPLAYHALESAPADAIDSSADYFDWNQVDPDGDLDGDGLCGSAEFFFGTDPFTPDAEGAAWSVELDPNGVPALTFQRSILAGQEGWLSPLQTSIDLENWLHLPNSTLEAFPATPSFDKLYYAPFYSPAEPQRYYRLIKPVAP